MNYSKISVLAKRLSFLLSGLILASLLALSGCGGGGGDDDPITPEVPIIRISVDSNGLGGDSTSQAPVVSADGRYVVFESSATNLVSGDTNNDRDIFVRDTQTNTITRVSVDSAGVESNGFSSRSSVSADGRYVAFQSSATNLVSGDLNGVDDIFLRDLVDNTTIRVSIGSGVGGVEGNGLSLRPSISADGGYVSFGSLANNLVSGDTNSLADVFVRDIVINTTTRVSIGTGINGTEGDMGSNRSAISNDGLFVAFDSRASNLVVNDTNGVSDIFLRDVTNNTTTRVSIATGINGAEADDGSLEHAISDDGNYVAFTSSATNLVNDDLNAKVDVFLRDIANDTTTRISVDSTGIEGNDTSSLPSMNTDVRFISFWSNSSNLVMNDTNGFRDVFVHDRQTGETTRLSVDTDGVEGNGNSGSSKISISSDGRYVVFASDASNLVSDDINLSRDIFRVVNSAAP